MSSFYSKFASPLSIIRHSLMPDPSVLLRLTCFAQESTLLIRPPFHPQRLLSSTHQLKLASESAGTETDRSRRTSLDSQSRNSSLGEHRSSSIKEGSSFQPVPEGQAVTGTDPGFPAKQSNGSLQNFAEGDLLRSESVPFAGQPQVVHIAPRYPFHK